SACWRDGGLAADGAVQCVDQRLDLDEFVARPFGLVAVERRGQHLGMRVPVLGHAFAGLLQRFKSLAHFGFFQWKDWRHAVSANPVYTDSLHRRHLIDSAIPLSLWPRRQRGYAWHR